MTTMPEPKKKILAVMTDLFFSVKIMDAAKKLGMTVEFLKDKDTVLDKVKAHPAVVIFDLNCDAADPIDLIQRIKSDPATKAVSTIGFISHVQIDLKLRAQQSGCDVVVARSVFAQTLPGILSRYATAETAARS